MATRLYYCFKQFIHVIKLISWVIWLIDFDYCCGSETPALKDFITGPGALRGERSLACALHSQVPQRPSRFLFASTTQRPRVLVIVVDSNQQTRQTGGVCTHTVQECWHCSRPPVGPQTPQPGGEELLLGHNKLRERLPPASSTLHLLHVFLNEQRNPLLN